jgi:hypothetical protein
VSRNTCNTSCSICHDDVMLEGEPGPITRDEAGPYFDEYDRQGLVVANASCIGCRAKYLAWVRIGGRFPREPYEGGPPFIDLSFRAAFNDEPAPEDLPTSEKLLEIHQAQCRATAGQLRSEAAGLLADADRIERNAVDGKSHWEIYRRLG